MTRLVQEQLLTRIAEISEDIRTLHRVEMEIATSGTSSATLSSGGGSKSYTRLDLSKIHELIRIKESELVSMRTRLTGQSPIKRTMFVRY